MAEVNDEATNALIASMLAEDNHYTEYDAYNIGPDSEDDDWGGSKKKQKKGLYLTKLLLSITKPQLHAESLTQPHASRYKTVLDRC